MWAFPTGRFWMEADTSPPPDPRSAEDEPPPFLGTWKRVYWAVLIYTATLSVLLYAMTVALRL
jgi:hypothetical protein